MLPIILATSTFSKNDEANLSHVGFLQPYRISLLEME